jgi:hypothetical protein
VPVRALRLAVLTTASTIVTTTLGLGAFAPAMADDSPAPVAVDDVATAQARGPEAGGVTFIDVLANDSAADGETLEICRVRAPERGLSVAEVQTNGDFLISSPHNGVSYGGGGSEEEDGREQLVVLPWANRAGTYQLTYWACDTKHLTPATVTVTVEKTPEVTVRKVDRPGRLRFTNPRTSRAVVIYGGLREERPDGRVALAPGGHETRRVVRHAIRWIAISPRTGEMVGEGFVRGIRLPGSASGGGGSAAAKGQLTPRMLRAWRSA